MQRRIRIASLITNVGFGGTANRLLSFARTIDKSRFDHVVISIYRKDESFAREIGSLHQAYVDAGVEVVDLGASPRKRILPGFRPTHLAHAGFTLTQVLNRLCRIIVRRKIDLIDAQHATATLFGVLAGALTRRPTTITQYFPTYFQRPGMRLLGEQVYARAGAFICDSQAHSDLINRSLRRPHPRSLVIPNGVPAPAVTRSRAEMRQHLNIPPDGRVIGQVGRLVEYKGQRVLLKAARQVLAQEPNTYVVLSGYPNEDPSFPEILWQDARDLNISDRVRIVSWPGSIGDIWELIDIHVHASLHDSLPIAITEGMSFGKPAVVTNVGGVEEMVTHEHTGLVVPMNDPGALAYGMLRLLREPETADRLGANARRRYQEHYRPEVMTRRLEEVFTDLLRMRA